MTETPGPPSKTETIDRRLLDRHGITLQAWVSHKIARRVTWRQMEADLQDALGDDRPPIGREGLRLWWQRQKVTA